MRETGVAPTLAVAHGLLHPLVMATLQVGRFEDLVERVLRIQSFRVASHVSVGEAERHHEIDLVLTWLDGEVTTAVEVKSFRTRMPSRQDIQLAYGNARRVVHALRLDHALLVVNARHSQLPPLTGDLEGISILCMEDLVWLAEGDDALIGELIEFDRELSSSLRDFDNPLDLARGRARPDLTKFKLHRVPRAAGGRSRGPRPLPQGEAIARDLEEIPAGEGEERKLPSGETGVPWRLLEIVGLRALRYLFDRQSHRWHEQGAVGGDDQRFDVLAKVKGDDVFSSMLVQDFRSRYVLFEFKNYKDQLKPNLIYVTEKYLFPTALRSTAIIVSPQGLSPAARSATHGALRDAGKLILDLPVPNLCRMLRARDAGALPDVEMEGRLDTFLQQIGR